MSTRGKALIAAFAFSLAVWAAVIHTALSAELAPAPLKVLSWVHVFGCPTPASDVVLWVQDGDKIRIVRLRVDKLSKEDKAALVAQIGEAQGINIQYKCGNEI